MFCMFHTDYVIAQMMRYVANYVLEKCHLLVEKLLPNETGMALYSEKYAIINKGSQR